MRKAIRLGAKGQGSVFPNPPVGAIIVKDHAVIGSGWHRAWGEKHAEILAIESALSKGHDIRGAKMFVSLEPCCHQGKTPPCTTAIIEHGFSEVNISCADDCDSRVCGGGIRTLRDAGIAVRTGLLEEEGRELIEHYTIQRRENRAFLTLKWASSLDGRIASATGDSQWISGEKARKFAHELRSRHSAVAVGFNTLMNDDPQLNVRAAKTHHQPVRVVLAGGNVIPEGMKVFDNSGRVILVNPSKKQPKIQALPDFTSIVIPKDAPFWKTLLTELPKHGIGSLMVEGGGEIITSALVEGAADRIYCVIAPIIIGKGISAVNDLEIKRVSDAVSLESIRYAKFGGDVMITGRVLRQL